MYKIFICLLSIIFITCKCDENDTLKTAFDLKKLLYNNFQVENSILKNFSSQSIIKFQFSSPIDSSSIRNNIVFKSSLAIDIAYQYTLLDNDSTLQIIPNETIEPFSKFYFVITKGLTNKEKVILNHDINLTILSYLDSIPVFPMISTDSLLTTIQKQCFNYFWKNAHPVSGLALERRSDTRTVTSGGSGFGIASIVVATDRNFITRTEATNRLIQILDFLEKKASRYHGAFAHWIHGSSGKTLPFSQYDNGGDLVETSYLMMGLLCARQYFNLNNSIELEIRNRITNLFEEVEWSFYRNEQNVLFWHWSPEFNWRMNFKILGWNEALITYILAASSSKYGIEKITYTEGWARNGQIRNLNTYYNYRLPLGPALGGPLFFEQYTFIGVNPITLTDDYADYQEQTLHHSLINYYYCIDNPKNFYGYSDQCWGLTASDTYGGYTAHEPNNDKGVISPTAALSSMPFTPTQSIDAAKYFYYILGEQLWTENGFRDAFSLEQNWFANDILAIDQGPIICMIENYRTGLLWKLFTSCPEIQMGMKKLGFKADYLK